MYQKIMLAFDGSQNSIRATKEAIKVASMCKECTIEIIYVVDYSKSKNDVLHAANKIDLEMTRRKKLLPAEELLKAHNIPYIVNILHGEAGPSIVEYANKQLFDLLVIGSRGLNTLQEMVLGSVSHKVVKRAKCPVLVVK